MPMLSKLIGKGPRVRIIRDGTTDPNGRCVVHWMQRGQRGRDNSSLDAAIEAGNALGRPVLTVFGLTADYPGAERRHYRFMLDALPEIRDELQDRGVGFVVRLGEPDEVVRAVAQESGAALIVGDENPVRVGRSWRDRLAERLEIPFACVDSDVVVPTSTFPREEYAARTIRPKIHRVLESFLVPFKNPEAEVVWGEGELPPGESIDPDRLLKRLRVGGASELPDYRGGPAEANRRLLRFLDQRLPRYATERNEPVPYMTSELSAHLHFGHVGPLTIALAVRDSGAPREAIDVYLEELIVRRELAVNFVARNPRYDSLEGCPSWAIETLARHAGDPRPYLYDASALEAAETHDPLWNAAQKEMILSGRMHNYLRMYWAKKILEWSPDAATAFEVALTLNDRYEMDGRDPNGYTGVAWAIGGKHDRPWPERPIFGTVRTMTYGGAQKKFDTAAYVDYVNGLAS
ncbi:MAG: deoxyribodipyrimidine photo-lyase [Isosphaeraceae bacterium]